MLKCLIVCFSNFILYFFPNIIYCFNAHLLIDMTQSEHIKPKNELLRLQESYNSYVFEIKTLCCVVQVQNSLLFYFFITEYFPLAQSRIASHCYMMHFNESNWCWAAALLIHVLKIAPNIFQGISNTHSKASKKTGIKQNISSRTM